jgi:hypothetical protein
MLTSPLMLGSPGSSLALLGYQQTKFHISMILFLKP